MYLFCGIAAGLFEPHVVLPVRSAHEGGRAVVVDEKLTLAAAHLAVKVGVFLNRCLGRGLFQAFEQNVAAKTRALNKRSRRAFTNFLMSK
jgi:hypothetical protein